MELLLDPTRAQLSPSPFPVRYDDERIIFHFTSGKVAVTGSNLEKLWSELVTGLPAFVEVDPKKESEYGGKELIRMRMPIPQNLICSIVRSIDFD